MRLIYCCEWLTDRKNTWSGTTLSLLDALAKIKEVKECDVTRSKLEKLINKLIGIRFVQGKFKFTVNDSWFVFSRTNKKLNAALKGDVFTPVLQIGDKGVCKNPFYLYQDLSVDALLDFCSTDPVAFSYSGFDSISTSQLQARTKIQHVVYDSCSGVFTMSKWLAEHLVTFSQLPPDKVHWVGAGINLDIKLIAPKQKNNRRILFVGRDFYRKGGDLTYDAFKILKDKYFADAELYIAGPSSWPFDECVEGVHFLGNVPYDELTDYFNLCDIFCLPSRFEAYGLVFIEALVFGLPCIARNAFAMNEFISDGITGYLVNDDNAFTLADKMRDLLMCDSIKKNVADNFDFYVKEYSWSTVARRISTVIYNK